MATMKPKKNPITKIIGNVGKAAVKAAKNTVEINTNPLKTTGFSNLKRKVSSMDTPANRAKAKAEKRGLKAANKPTNKVGSKADKALRSRAKSVSMSKEQAVKSYDAMYGKGVGKDITQINKRVVPKNEARSVRQLPKKKK